jgi:site-specific DNA-methyltransferase (adenine-specific)/modification methylase
MTGLDKFRSVQIQDATLYLGDCLEILPLLPNVDAVVTDPPYGIAYQTTLANLGATVHKNIKGDESAPNLSQILNMPTPVLCFGANCFPDQLPHRGRWLCWDKRTIDGACDGMLGSPIELAWSNKTSGYDKIVRVLHGGVVNADGGPRVHPTQKPIQVMIESIQWAARDALTILDPYMGSGTTGVACAKLGRKFIGIEIEPKYFDIACKRIEEAYAQPDMFVAEPEPQPKQTDMLKAAE